MRRTFSSIFLLFPIGLILLFFVSCGPAVFVETALPTSATTFEMLATPILETPSPTASPACSLEDWTCPSDSLTLTAEMGSTLSAVF